MILYVSIFIRCILSIQTSAQHNENESRQEQQAAGAAAPDDEPRRDLPTQIIMARILMLCFLAEHNLSFNLADHMCDLFQAMFPDSAIASGLSMRRTSATEMAKKFCLFLNDDLVVRLRKNKFSIIIDETTDSAHLKSLTIVVKFYDQDDGFIKTKMLELIDIYMMIITMM